MLGIWRMKSEFSVVSDILMLTVPLPSGCITVEMSMVHPVATRRIPSSIARSKYVLLTTLSLTRPHAWFACPDSTLSTLRRMQRPARQYLKKRVSASAWMDRLSQPR